MIPTAVMSKDLRLRMRGWRWAGVVTLYVAILAAVALAFLLQRYNPAADQPSIAGIRLLQSLALFQLFLLLFVTPASVAGAISGERQQRTWDLLLVSQVPPREIVWGKLLAGIAFNLVLICASLPFFSLVFLFGGVTLGDLIPSFVVFLATVCLLSSASLLVSALTARLTVSYMISMLVALTLTVGLSLLVLDLQAPQTPGLLPLGSIAFSSVAIPMPLTPLAQLDPLVALLSALPSENGMTFLGHDGTVQHAFGLPWALPLWGAYALLAALLSLVLILVTIRLIHHPVRWRIIRVRPRRSARRLRASLSAADGQADGGS